VRNETLIVSATYDDSYPEWYDALPQPKVRWSTAEGGHPSQALIRAFRADHHRHRAYLLLQDSLEPLDANPAALFEQAAVDMRTPVVGWARFPMFFDEPEQELKVTQQYPWVKRPAHGIFGPIFWVERKVMERLDKMGRFPKAPENKMDAQGTERAWAYAFQALGIEPRFLHDWSNEFLASGEATPFRKVFADRK
jgi:hypothetical protein